MTLVRQSNWHWLCALSLALAAGCSNILPPDFGVREGHLAACPTDRDCVSSQDTDESHHIAPLEYQSSRDKAHDDLLAAIITLPDGRIVSNHRNYVRVQFAEASDAPKTSKYFYQLESAVDEVEFYLAPTGQLIEVRALGKQGLLGNGTNRARIEHIRAVLQKLQQPHD
jgi:uncharacterized protein (DUF1499 family)